MKLMANAHTCSVALRVEFLLKTDGGYPRDAGVFFYSRWQTLGVPSALTPIGQLHQSPPSPVPGDLGRCPSHQSHVTLFCFVLLTGFWFLVCYAATPLATQLRQRCIQVVHSNKEARKRLTESNGTPAMDFGYEEIRKRNYTQTKNRTKHTTTIVI